MAAPMPQRCMYTACLLLATAAFLQCRDQRVTALNVAFLLLGVTSVVHHSRMSAWKIRDAVFGADVVMCVAFAAAAARQYGDELLFWAAAAYAVGVVATSWMDGFSSVERTAAWHGSVHLMVCITALALSTR